MSAEFLGLVSVYGPIVAMVAVFYFMLYRPQKAEQAKRRELLQNLRKGNKVVTIGGIHGEIVNIKDNILDLKIADKVVIKVSRAAINTNASQGLTVKEDEEDIKDE